MGIISAETLYPAESTTNSNETSDLGDGGTERWIAYPVVLWQVVFGGNLMAEPRPATAATASDGADENP